MKRKKRSKVKFFLRRYKTAANIFLWAVIALAALVGIAYAILVSDYFRIETILVSGTKQFVNPTDVEQLARAKTSGKNIFFFDVSELEENLANNLLGAKKYQVKKTLPDKLKIKVTERVPIAIVYQENDEYFLVDEEGYVLGYTTAENKELPRINFEEEIKVGFFINKDVVPVYLELSQLFQEEKIKVSTMSFYPQYVNFSIERGPEVFIGSQKSLRESVMAIAALIKQTELEDKEIERIDLRYDKVIVSFK
jgi:cell division septal protein FtsQ